MIITGTHFNYFQICPRKLWLFVNNITFEHTSDIVSEGKLIHEESYPQRTEKYEEVEIEGVKIDYYDSKNKVIHEIKKSNKVEKAHEWQLKYYMYVFEKYGIDGVSGVLEYPSMRKTSKVFLDEADRETIRVMMGRIEEIANCESCPPIQKRGLCRNCSYFDFCNISEAEE